MSYHEKQMTLAIIKPDSVAKGNSGTILQMIEDAGLTVVALKMLRLTQEQAAHFYAIHKEKAFFQELTSFMSSGKIIVLALEAVDAINLWRKTMGATDPTKALDGTIRKKFGSSITSNACHGSDAIQTAKEEISFFFTRIETIL